MKVRDLPEGIRKWSERPAVKPRYKGATPADVARALLGKQPETVPAKSEEKEK